jgi:hypothetical protein
MHNSRYLLFQTVLKVSKPQISCHIQPCVQNPSSPGPTFFTTSIATPRKADLRFPVLITESTKSTAKFFLTSSVGRHATNDLSNSSIDLYCRLISLLLYASCRSGSKISAERSIDSEMTSLPTSTQFGENDISNKLRKLVTAH